MSKTVKVRIAVAIDPNGMWNSAGWKDGDDSDAMNQAIEPLDTGEARYWVTAELPLPEIPTVEGTVETEP